jgi:hypothetical protein
MMIRSCNGSDGTIGARACGAPFDDETQAHECPHPTVPVPSLEGFDRLYAAVFPPTPDPAHDEDSPA